MSHRPQVTRIDDRLARLLEVERRLEARVRDAEEAARAQVSAAHERAHRAQEDHGAELDAATRAEENEDLGRHAAELRRIAEEGAACVARLSAVPDPEIDRLATRAVATVLATEEGRQS